MTTLEYIINNSLFWLITLTIYAIVVVRITKNTYHWMINKGLKHNVAVYYNRKIIHIFAGGIIAILVPYIFPNQWYPLFCGLVLTFFTYIPHHTGKILYWFQTKDNLNDVSFCLMWAITVFLLWTILGNPWIAIIPPAFMAFGDAITGVVRNTLYRKRTKHPIGNLFMLIVCIPIGYYFANLVGIPIWGIIAAIAATFVERYEFGIIDDNILITTISAIILLIGTWIGPLL